jgi:hypothetical protein
MMDDGDVRMNLWKLFSELRGRHGGKHSSRVDIAISDTASVAPDAFYYRKGRNNIMIEDDYFCAAPDLIAEVLFAPSRALDRGPRLEVYRRAGVPHVWLLEPALETIELYKLHSRYELAGRFGPGGSFTNELFPGERISVDDLFETQSKRWPAAEGEEAKPDAIPQWILPPEMTIGLEYFFHLGHPERRWEAWGNKARSVLAFGSATEAHARFDHFLTEACRWEAAPRPKVGFVAADAEQSEVGRFQLSRQGRLVFLDVAIDGKRYRDLLTIWANSDVWDWGED